MCIEFYFVAIIIAVKFNEDKYYTNRYYSKIGGMDLRQLNEMEMELLLNINFDLYIEDFL